MAVVAKGDATPSSRVPGCDLSNDDAAKFFASHVTLEHCTPKECFKAKLTKSLRTSDWGATKRYFNAIQDLLDMGDGHIPHQDSTQRHFESFLKRNGHSWSSTDRDKVVRQLRAMPQALLARKRNGDGPPKGHNEFGILMDKLKSCGNGPAIAQSRTGPSRTALQTPEAPTAPTTAPTDVVVVPNALVDTIELSSGDEDTQPVPQKASVLSMIDFDALEVSLFGAEVGSSTQIATTPPSKLSKALDAETLKKLSIKKDVGPAATKKRRLNGKTTTPMPGMPHLPPAVTTSVDDEDPLKDYLDLSVLGKPMKTIQKRAHSKCWHLERDRCAALGLPDEECKEKASLYTFEQLCRWRRLVGAI